MEKAHGTAAAHNPAAFFSLIGHPVRFKLYLLKNLPAGYFSGLKLEQVAATACIVSVPFKWFTRNPFRSTYFACLSMAAEMSTGVLAMAQVYGRKRAVSLLVTGIEGRFYKKATGKTFFTCSDGNAIADAVNTAVSTATPQEIKAHSIGRNAAGELLCEFWVQWSFKTKRS